MSIAQSNPLELLRDELGDGAVREPGPSDTVNGVMPRAVVAPDSVAQASAVLRRAHEARWHSVIKGSGTKIAWGNAPEHFNMLLETTKLNAILEYTPGDFVIRAQSGIALSSIQRATAEHGQMLGLDPAEHTATLGGVVATATSGPMRLRYGTPRDLVIGATLVLADGTIAKSGGKVVKNVAGYDLAKLFCGSYGTLGLIAEVNVRLHPIPRSTAIIQAKFVNEDCIRTAATTLVRDGSLDLFTCEMLWDIANKFTVMYFGFRGAPDSLVAQSTQASAHLEALGATVERLDQKPPRQSRAELVLRVGVAPSEFVATARLLRDLAGSSGVSLYGLPLSGTLDANFTNVADIAALVRRIRERVSLIDGSVVVLDAPADAAEYLDAWGSSATSVAMMARVKERFDPARLLAPGRFVGGI